MNPKRIFVFILIIGCVVSLFLLLRASFPLHSSAHSNTLPGDNSSTAIAIQQPPPPTRHAEGTASQIPNALKSSAMVQDDGKISYLVAKEVNLTDKEILQLQSIVDTHWESMSRLVAAHTLPDPLRTDAANGIDAFRIPAFLGGEIELRRLREALSLEFGEKAEVIFGSLRTFALFGNFGNNEVLIQFHNMNDEDEARIVYTAQEYDPQTGKKIRGTSGRMKYLKQVYGNSFKIK